MVSASVSSVVRLRRSARRDSSNVAIAADVADAMCCGAQLVWNSQPPKPEGAPITRCAASAPNRPPSSGRKDSVAASATTQSAAAPRPLSQTAKPIIAASDAKAVNQVSAASASQPLTCASNDNSAALKCQR